AAVAGLAAVGQRRRALLQRQHDLAAGRGGYAAGRRMDVDRRTAARLCRGRPPLVDGRDQHLLVLAGNHPRSTGRGAAVCRAAFWGHQGQIALPCDLLFPYIAPFVGTAAVFRIIFSSRPTGSANRIISALGGDTLSWLNEPTGVFQLILGNSVTLPAWATGPSLALVVIIIYGTWTFVGFNTVIFMAGLGNIPRELYEAAEIDGGGKWALFRHITLPMLSPTLYFLTLYSVIRS